MTKATTRRFFFVGTALFTLVFIRLTMHTHSTIAARTHSDRLDDAWCADCTCGSDTTARTATRCSAKAPTTRPT